MAVRLIAKGREKGAKRRDDYVIQVSVTVVSIIYAVGLIYSVRCSVGHDMLNEDKWVSWCSLQVSSCSPVST